MSNMPSANDAKTTTSRDTLFADGERHLVDFAFDEDVAAVFPDMIRRSVPGYETMLPLTGLLAARHLPVGGRCFDLGCSLGAASHAVLAAVGRRPCEVIGVDDSPAMLERARQLAGDEPRLRWLEADVREVDFGRADVVILNYTLQFLPVDDRQPLLAKIRGALADAGVVLIAEKLRSSRYFAEAHLDFKRANGYSELEVSGKRSALENVMRIDSQQTHLKRLQDAGFADAKLWFRCLNWGTFAAWPRPQL